MIVGRHGYGLHTKSRPPLCRLCYDQAGMAERNSALTVCLSDVVRIKPEASETYGSAGRCKQTVLGPSNTLHTCTGFRAVSLTIHSQTIAYTGDLVHCALPCRLASALTVGYYTSL